VTYEGIIYVFATWARTKCKPMDTQSGIVVKKPQRGRSGLNSHVRNQKTRKSIDSMSRILESEDFSHTNNLDRTRQHASGCKIVCFRVRYTSKAFGHMLYLKANPDSNVLLKSKPLTTAKFHLISAHAIVAYYLITLNSEEA